ncbi:MAG: hypothetical protein IPL46_20755 [Saprospiraceae bacterium]|nr:hypothetical protein [Saprospiraceae bacterium]
METRRKFIKNSSALTTMGLLYNWSFASTSSDAYGDVLPKRRLTRDGTMVTAFVWEVIIWELQKIQVMPKKWWNDP